MNKSFLKILIGILFLYQLPLKAADTDSLHLKKSMNTPEKSFFSEIYQNAGLFHFRPDAFNHGDINIKYNYSDFGDLRFVQDGESLSQYKLEAKGLTVQNNKIFWGDISYRNYQRKNVKWNDVYNYEKLGPYFLADSVGGKSYGEEYELSGGLSIKSNKWIFGGEAGYTAGNNYRKNDPRPKATSTDLHMELSSSYNLLKNYQAGLSINAGTYREKVDVKIMQDKDKDAFFPFKGFGLVNEKWKETKESFSSSYKGENYGGTLFFAPQNGNGFLGDMKFNYSFIKPSYDSNIPNEYNYKTYNTSFNLGWQRFTPDARSYIKFNYDYNLGKGIEYIYYSQTINNSASSTIIYHLLSSAWFYTKKAINYNLSGGHEWISSKNIKWITVNVGYQTDEERYLYPEYKMRFERITSALEFGGEFHTNTTSAFIPKIGILYSPALHSDKILPQNNEIFDQAFAPNISYLEADLFGFNASFTYQHNLKSIGSLYASIDANYLNGNDSSRYNIGFAIGMKY